MLHKMPVIGGSMDGQWKEWDDQERVMRATLSPSTEYTVIYSPEGGILPKPEVEVETYYVEHLRVNRDFLPFLIFSKLRNPEGTMEAEDILRHLLQGYRKPNPCPECKKVPTDCAYCGYRK